MSLLRLHLNATALTLPPLLPHLPPSTHSKIQSYHFPTDRSLALGSALLQRYLICRLYTPSCPTLRSVVLAKDPRTSRPFYPDAATAQPVGDRLTDYNTTHHNPRESPPGERAVVAVVARLGAGGRVGLDVTPTRQKWATGFLETFLDASTGVFTAGERDRVREEETEAGQVRCVLVLWALKEAYVKAVGEGLGIELERVEFKDVVVVREGRYTGTRMWVDGVDVTGKWVVEVEFLPGLVQEGANEGEGFYLAVVAEREGLREEGGEWREVTLEEIVEFAGKE